MKCLDCRFLVHSIKGSSEQQTLDYATRSWLVSNLDSLLDVIELTCSKGLRQFSDGTARDVLYLLELDNKCKGYQDAAKHPVRWPLWYKILIVITIILAVTAATAGIWQAVSN